MSITRDIVLAIVVNIPRDLCKHITQVSRDEVASSVGLGYTKLELSTSYVLYTYSYTLSLFKGQLILYIYF